jgi:putative acyl-CoA dehydrogenase
LTVRLARSFDEGEGDRAERAFARMMTPIVKYWVCKMVPPFAYEAMECLGGNGYVEDGVMARVYREAPLNAIWEGAGNVMCLDVMRAMEKSPDVVDRVFAHFSDMASGDSRLGAALGALKDRFAARGDLLTDARFLVERLACVAAGCLLRRHGDPAVADAFVASRLDGGWRHSYGTVRGMDTAAVLERLEARG